jgi:hypothetical protein
MRGPLSSAASSVALAIFLFNCVIFFPVVILFVVFLPAVFPQVRTNHHKDPPGDRPAPLPRRWLKMPVWCGFPAYRLSTIADWQVPSRLTHAYA